MAAGFPPGKPRIHHGIAVKWAANQLPIKKLAAPIKHPNTNARSEMISDTGRISANRNASSAKPTMMKNTSSGWPKKPCPNGRRSPIQPNVTPPTAANPYHHVSA